MRYLGNGQQLHAIVFSHNNPGETKKNVIDVKSSPRQTDQRDYHCHYYKFNFISGDKLNSSQNYYSSQSRTACQTALLKHVSNQLAFYEDKQDTFVHFKQEKTDSSR